MVFNENYIYSQGKNKMVVKLFHSTVNSVQRIYRQYHHTEFEISVFISGMGKYTGGKKTHDFISGDVFIFSSDEVHCITEIFLDELMDLVNIHFEPRFNKNLRIDYQETMLLLIQ